METSAKSSKAVKKLRKARNVNGAKAVQVTSALKIRKSQGLEDPKKPSLQKPSFVARQVGCACIPRIHGSDTRARVVPVVEDD
jgi:hypothetical protein